jgi:guanyl-specific ribonuclease Sa
MSDVDQSPTTTSSSDFAHGGAQSSKALTAAEIKEWLRGCIEIPKDKWRTIPDNSHVSYVKKDGKFVKGGFIRLQYSKDGEHYIRYGSKLASWPGDKYYREFTIKLSNTSKIYKRVSQDSIFEFKVMQMNFDKQMQTVIDRQDQLDGSIKKIVKLIKKLHNIKSLDDMRNSMS